MHKCILLARLCYTCCDAAQKLYDSHFSSFCDLWHFELEISKMLMNFKPERVIFNNINKFMRAKIYAADMNIFNYILNW